jgi:hypothetical protein
LLASLQLTSPARAYEADIHFSTTYVLARAVGWTEADALTIASANQGVDENQDTVAALEMDTTTSRSVVGYIMSSLRQAEKNLRFHCFSKSHGAADGVAADVLEVLSGHFAGVAVHDADLRKNTGRLIALGVALHCQQDAHAHVEFGGSCGPYAGSCYGHTHENLLDQVVFGLLKKHYYNPDHPGVSGERLLEALQGTARALATHRPRGSVHSILANGLVALSDALRASGLDLPDDVRRECNRYVAGKWLQDLFRSRSRTDQALRERLAPSVAVTCRNPSLASATVIRIPEPRYPRLDADASPRLVRADGTYQLLRDGDVDLSVPGIVSTHKVKVQLSHWSQLLALPLAMKVALLAEDGDRRMR